MDLYRSPLAKKLPQRTEPIQKPTGYLGQLQRVKDEIEARACQDISFSKPIVELNGTGIVYPNSITTIQGQKGSHKSRLTELICAAILSRSTEPGPIGITVDNTVPFHIVYIDTERNKNDQLPYAIQRIKEKAGFGRKDRPPNLEAISLIDIDRESRFEALAQYMEEVRNTNPEKFIVVVLDVITDCIGSFNDPKESLKLIDHLNKLINEHDISFICIIHENPNSIGDSKARGHLGTEIINKATTALSIGFEKSSKELVNIKFLHTRSSRRPEPVQVHYCDRAKGLVLADETFVSENKGQNALKAGPDEVRKWIMDNLQGEISKSEIIFRLSAAFNCKAKTIETRLKELTDGPYSTLERIKKGKEVYFTKKVPF